MALYLLAATIRILPRLCGSVSAMAEIAEHRINAVPDHQIDRPEIRREQENRDDHHRRRGLYFLERRRRDLLHLGAHVVVESLDPLWPGFDGRCQRILFRNTRHGLFLLSFFPVTTPAVLVASPDPRKFWQGRRDSNPQVRFWRPTV